MSMSGHVSALQKKHGAIDAQLLDEDHRPQPDAETLHRLKVAKLHIKDELTRLVPPSQDAPAGH